MNDVLAELKTLLEAEFTEYTHYQGEVVLVPKSYLPAMMVFAVGSSFQAHSTAKHKREHQIKIRVVQDVVEKFTESGTGDIIKAQRDLVNVMEEADADGTPLSSTVLGVLLRNIKGDKYLFHDDFNIVYTTLQPNEFFYVAAELTLTSTDLVLRQ